MNVNVTGADVARAALGAYGEAVQGRVNRVLDASALRIERGAKRAAPVDTGRLRASVQVWTPPRQPGVRVVGTNVQYAPHVEFGTRRMRARPFLGPAHAAEAPRLRAALADALRGGAR